MHFSRTNQTKLSQLLQGRLPHTHLLQIHAQIILTGTHQNNLIATRLIGHYPPHQALKLFNHLHNPNVFPFNATIRILSDHHALFPQAFSLFKTLKSQSVPPNDFTFSFLLKACFRANNVQIVQQIHTHVVKSGFECNSNVCSGLLAVYAKGVKDLDSARKLFDEMPDRGSVFCWTCLIAGYANSGRGKEGLGLFLRMLEEGVKPQDDTVVSVLSACSSLEVLEIERWERIFVEFGACNNVSRDSVDTVLVYLYGKLGKVDKGRNLFDEIIERGGGRSVLPWNAMIGVYVQNGCPAEALDVFKLMVGGGVYAYPRPNHVTMVSVLSSCAQVGDLELGKWVHGYLKTSRPKGIVESNALVGTALIDMYSKCGGLESAKVVFDRMVAKDVVSYNAMIMGFATNGQGEDALRLFSKMEELCVKPNGGTFLSVLSACNHSGMVGEGRRIFLEMVPNYSCIPEIEHYACYIDLLARGGHVEEALEVVNSMPAEPNGIVLGGLLQGCLTHTRADLAKEIAARLIKVDPAHSGGYVMLSNAYASNQEWSEISQLRRSMRERRVMKQPGSSWLEIN